MYWKCDQSKRLSDNYRISTEKRVVEKLIVRFAYTSDEKRRNARRNNFKTRVIRVTIQRTLYKPFSRKLKPVKFQQNYLPSFNNCNCNNWKIKFAEARVRPNHVSVWYFEWLPLELHGTEEERGKKKNNTQHNYGRETAKWKTRKHKEPTYFTSCLSVRNSNTAAVNKSGLPLI